VLPVQGGEMFEAEEEVYLDEIQRHRYRIKLISGCYKCLECGVGLKEMYATNCIARPESIGTNDLICDDCLPYHRTLCKLAN